MKRDDSDFKIEWFSGSGKGGQHRNRHMNSCRIRHLPTGLLESRQGRSRTSNKKDAMDCLNKRLDEEGQLEVNTIQSALRQQQTGSGMRGDKIRTIRFQDDKVVDHRTGKSMSAKKYMKGFMNLLY